MRIDPPSWGLLRVGELLVSPYTVHGSVAGRFNPRGDVLLYLGGVLRDGLSARTQNGGILRNVTLQYPILCRIL